MPRQMNQTRQMVPWPLRMFSTTLPPPCSTISKVIIKSCVCRLCILVCHWRMKQLNSSQSAFVTMLEEVSLLMEGHKTVHRRWIRGCSFSTPHFLCDTEAWTIKSWWRSVFWSSRVIHETVSYENSLVRPLAAYFIMNNRIYQSPDVYTVISNRLVCLAAILSRAFLIRNEPCSSHLCLPCNLPWTFCESTGPTTLLERDLSGL